MTNRHVLALLLAAVAMIAPGARAQPLYRGGISPKEDPADRQSHVPIGPSSTDPQALLNERLNRSKDFANLERFARDLFKNQDPDKLDPAVRKQLEKYLADPENREVLDKLIKQSKQNNPDATTQKPPDWLVKEVQEAVKKKDGGRTNASDANPSRPPNADKPPNSPKPDTSKGNSPAPSSKKEPSPMSRWFEDRLRDAQKPDSSLSQNKTTQKIFRDLGRSFAGASTRAKGDEPSWASRLGKLDGLKALAPPSWRPNVSMPRVNWGSGSSWSLGRMPSIGTPAVSGSPAAGDLWKVLLWLGAAGLVVLIGWRVLSWRKDAAGRASGPGVWRLGPWPIHPTAIRTREDLVRAFEYLSVLLLGPKARSWNHRDIAAQLGTDLRASEARRRAADHLAEVYERSRYAPLTDPLPDADLAAARHDLCLLAGVAVA